MTLRNVDRKYRSWKCGKCKHDIMYLVGEAEPSTCDECGAVYSGTTSSTTNTTTGKAIGGGDLVKVKEWKHKSRDQHDIPSQIKLDLNNPNG